MLQLDVKAEFNRAARNFPLLASKIRPIAARALNEVATSARTQAIRAVTAETKLPQKFIRSRVDIKGEAKGERSKLTKANRNTLTADLNVYMRGIPVFQVAGAAVNPWNVKGRKHRRGGGGVKAKGGRFYSGAFKARGLVLKRQGPGRKPLLLPKIGVREKLRAQYDDRITGAEGVSSFIARFTRMARSEQGKLGIT